jgi:hypothetical protein
MVLRVNYYTLILKEYQSYSQKLSNPLERVVKNLLQSVSVE